MESKSFARRVRFDFYVKFPIAVRLLTKFRQNITEFHDSEIENFHPSIIANVLECEWNSKISQILIKFVSFSKSVKLAYQL